MAATVSTATRDVSAARGAAIVAEAAKWKGTPYAAIGAASAAQADQWPSRLIRATIPFGAGSATDVVPRLVFDRLAVELGQSIVVENRPGAGGTLGTAMVAKAAPAGYSVLGHSSALTIGPAIYSPLSYDVSRDFAAVLMIGYSPNVMIVPITRTPSSRSRARDASAASRVVLAARTTNTTPSANRPITRASGIVSIGGVSIRIMSNCAMNCPRHSFSRGE